ncbi:MAG: SAM hydroxide adenosyltransferase, partial [Spirochaetota bacterium]
LGRPMATFQTRPYPGYTVSGNGITGQILHIDHFGNCVTSIPVDKSFKNSTQVLTVPKKGLALPTVTCQTYTHLAGNQAGLLPGSSGYIELSMNQDSPASRYGIEIEDEVVIRYE